MTPALHDALRAACADVGIVCREIPADGRWHGTDVEGDRRGRGDGRIKLFPNGEGGIVYNWKGESRPFFAEDGRRLSESERRERDRKRQEAIRLAAEEQARCHEKAANKALNLWRAASLATADNPYLKRKGVAPVSSLREIEVTRVAAQDILGYAPKQDGEPLVGRLLVVPVKIGGKLSSVELIDGNKRKHAIAGGAMGGGYWAAQPLPDGNGNGVTLMIGEGVATVLSVREATGQYVFAARYRGNLKRVAQEMRTRYPAATIIVLADLGNGQKDAEDAAKAVGGLLAVPNFGADRSDGATDFNDMAQARGAEVVRKCIEAAQPVAADGNTEATADSTVHLLKGSDLKPEPIRWLWENWLARGKLHIIAGSPGTGKTTLALALAATTTAGGRWPDGTRADVGNILIWSGEDDVRDTLLPRLLAMGAHGNRVYFIGEVLADGMTRPFDPARDMSALACEAARIGDIRLLIVDPVVNAVTGDSHKNTEVRRSLQPLVDLAARLDAVALGVSHFSKGTAGRDPVERVTGSVAFGALPRVVFGTAKATDDEDHTVRLFVRAKSNIGPDGGGFNYSLEQVEVPGFPGLLASRVAWEQPLDGTARDLLAVAEIVEDGGERGAIGEAAEFLRGILVSGPLGAKEVEKDANGAGHAWRTVQEAAKRIGVDRVKDGMRGGWTWSLRAGPKAQEAPKAQEGAALKSMHLRASSGEPTKPVGLESEAF